MPEEELSIPFRMLDLFTGNLVDIKNYGPLDKYCILSYSWKGMEIDYEYFARSKKSADRLNSKYGDIGAVVNQAQNGACEPYRKLQELIDKSDNCQNHGIKTVEALLKMYFEDLDTEKNATSADKAARQAVESNIRAKWETEHYNSYLEDFNKRRSKGGVEQADRTSQEARKKLDDKIKKLKEDAQADEDETFKKQNEAHTKLEKRRAGNDTAVHDIKIIYAIEYLLEALYHRKSAHKLLGAVNQAKETFNLSSFQQTGRQYLWLDNCCIKKSNVGEYTESMARMGECDDEWIKESSKVFLSEEQANDLPYNDKPLAKSEAPNAQDAAGRMESNDKKEELIHKVIDTFSELKKLTGERKKIYWATRGWTLQELVLSRATYYFNSNWAPLNRDVEVLGPYYNFVPFIKQYLSLQFVESGHCGATVPAQDFDKGEAEQLIYYLQSLNLEPPQGIEKRTAAAQIGKMVYMAAATKDKTVNELYESMAWAMPLNGLKDRIFFINTLLHKFVTQADAAIMEDRKHVQQIGRIDQLTNWVEGTEPVNASARSILNMASERKVTTPIDQVYSLMGILGVRFFMFQAEGLPKALCRLLDEVLVTSNDVSVFNWSGRHAGSLIRGRSLYPRNIEAFQNSIDTPRLQEQATINHDIIKLFHNERYHKANRARSVNWCLENMIEKTHELEKNCSIPTPLKNLVYSISESKFECVANYLKNLRGVVEKLNKVIDNEKEDRRRKKDSFQHFLGQTGLGGKSYKDKTQQETTETAAVKTEVEEPAPQAPGTQREAEDQEDKKNKEVKQASTLSPNPEARKKEWDELKDQVDKTTKSIEDRSQSDPEGVNSTLDAEPQTKKSKALEARMVCPNPVIVTSAGIRGIFDIQRVLIRMQDPKLLWAKVHNATSGQRIEGSCTISTGFSIILVGFACEKETLEQQLELTEVIESQLFQNSGKQGDGTPNANETNNSPPAEESNDTTVNSGDTAQDASPEVTHEEVRDKKEATETVQEVKGEDPEAKTNESYEDVEKNHGNEWNDEQKRVHHIIKFVQEDDLHAIAGEWVLARFSHVEGAEWFLCRLELGSGDDLYARRIPTDAFSFHDGVPEAGLIDHWQNYMGKQKRLMCNFLLSFLMSQIEFQSANESLAERARKKLPEKTLDGPNFQLFNNPFTNTSGAEAAAMIQAAGSGLSGMKYKTFSKLFKRATKNQAMRSVPTKLRPAIRKMSDGGHLFPMMYHSSRSIHMF